MKKYFALISVVVFSSFQLQGLPEGWRQIDKTKINGEKIEIYFFDYMSKLGELKPGYEKLKGREFTEALRQVQFRFPAYVAKKAVKKEDSVFYFVLRPNESKARNPYFFDLQIVKVQKDFQLQSLLNESEYKERIIKTTDATACRGSLITEYNKTIREHPNKEKLIGNGVQVTDSIFIRVIPYAEFKNAFYRLIEANL